MRAYLVGERENSDRPAPREWSLRRAFSHGAFAEGSSSRRRLEEWFDLESGRHGPWLVRTCNLLPPSPDAGAWDAMTARRMAEILALRVSRRRGPCRLLIFGRRVARAFHCGDLLLCEVGEALGVPVLVLPHPSGRNRWLNEPENRERVAESIRLFLPDALQ